MAILKLFTVITVLTFIQCQELESNRKPIRPLCLRINEVYYQSGPSCDQTCHWLNAACSLKRLAVAGCYCRPGYVRDANNKCVEGNSFCGNCPQNEFYTEFGSPCQTECATLGRKCNIVNVRAPSGCYCNPGYARNAHGVCILINQCGTCVNGTEWSECGKCYRTCQNYAFIRCPFGCANDVAGCYCPDDLIWDEESSQCVRMEDCHTCFGQGQVWKRNGPCDRHCNKLVKCVANPGPACYCQDGYVRNDAGICVLQNECTPISNVCTNGKVWMDCGQCINAQSCGTYALVRCSNVCLAAGCYCPDDQVINESTGNCILKSLCPLVGIPSQPLAEI